MFDHSRIIVLVCLIGLLAGLIAGPVAAQGTNKPGNPQVQEQVLIISEWWDGEDQSYFDYAPRSYESVSAQYPGTLEAELAFVELQRIRFLRGGAQAVLDDYPQWLASGPSPIAQAHALSRLADWPVSTGNYAKAEQQFKQAIALAGDHPVAGLAALHLARMYVRKMPSRASEGFALYEETAKKFAGTPFEVEARRQWACELNP